MYAILKKLKVLSHTSHRMPYMPQQFHIFDRQWSVNPCEYCWAHIRRGILNSCCSPGYIAQSSYFLVNLCCDEGWNQYRFYIRLKIGHEKIHLQCTENIESPIISTNRNITTVKSESNFFCGDTPSKTWQLYQLYFSLLYIKILETWKVYLLYLIRNKSIKSSKRETDLNKRKWCIVCDVTQFFFVIAWIQSTSCYVLTIYKYGIFKAL